MMMMTALKLSNLRTQGSTAHWYNGYNHIYRSVCRLLVSDSVNQKIFLVRTGNSFYLIVGEARL